MKNINVVWFIHPPCLPDPSRPPLTSEGQVEEVYYRYHRLREEDRPLVIQVFGSGPVDAFVNGLQTVDLPAVLVPHYYLPASSLPAKASRFLFHRERA